MDNSLAKKQKTVMIHEEQTSDDDDKPIPLWKVLEEMKIGQTKELTSSDGEESLQYCTQPSKITQSMVSE